MTNSQEKENLTNIKKLLIDSANGIYAEILDTIPLGVCRYVCNDKMSIIYANRMCCKFFGYEAKPEALMNLKAVILPLDYERMRDEVVDSVAKKQETFVVEGRFVAENGHERWLLEQILFACPQKKLSVPLLILQKESRLRRSCVSAKRNTAQLSHTAEKSFFAIISATEVLCSLRSCFLSLAFRRSWWMIFRGPRQFPASCLRKVFVIL